MPDFLESPAVVFAAPLVEVERRRASLAGVSIGPYRVLHELARGGMDSEESASHRDV